MTTEAGDMPPVGDAMPGRARDGAHPSPYAAVIEQAKGLIMGEYAVSADAAFEMIRKWSRDRNRKVRDVCADLVAAADPDDAAPVVPVVSRTTLEEATAALADAARRRRANRGEKALSGVKSVIA